MAIRPYRIIADYDPTEKRFIRADVLDCDETTHPITGQSQAVVLFESRRSLTEQAAPELFTAINAHLNQAATDAAIATQRAAHLAEKQAEANRHQAEADRQAAKQAEAARLAELETAKTTKKD